jgi:hypothetical protein
MRFRAGLTSLTVALLAAGATVPAAAVTHRPAVPAKSLAGHVWRYNEQIDGKGGVDKVVIDAGKDLTLDRFGPGSGGSGHFTVRVHLAGTTTNVSSRQLMGGYLSPRKHWTPFYGATNLDHKGGKEILVGFSTGAHLQSFTALTYSGGTLTVLAAPENETYWSVNNSFGTGSDGWLCTSKGVEGRSVTPTNSKATHFRIVRNTFVYKSGGWVRTHHFATTVKAKSPGNPPKYTDSYAEFACPGLPAAL